MPILALSLPLSASAAWQKHITSTSLFPQPTVLAENNSSAVARLCKGLAFFFLLILPWMPQCKKSTIGWVMIHYPLSFKVAEINGCSSALQPFKQFLSERDSDRGRQREIQSKYERAQHQIKPLYCLRQMPDFIRDFTHTPTGCNHKQHRRNGLFQSTMSKPGQSHRKAHHLFG